METTEYLTVRLEACSDHVGDLGEPCDVCGWLFDDHGSEAIVVALPVPLPLAA